MNPFDSFKKEIDQLHTFLKVRAETLEKDYNKLITMLKHVLEDYVSVKAGDLVKLTLRQDAGVLVLLIEELLQEDGLKAKARIVACADFPAEVAAKFPQGNPIEYNAIEILAMGFKIEKGNDELATLLYAKQP